jgi:hypothetical protein
LGMARLSGEFVVLDHRRPSISCRVPKLFNGKS